MSDTGVSLLLKALIKRALVVNQQDTSLNLDLKTELDTFARHIKRKLGMREKAQVFSYVVLLVIQAMELPRCSTTKPVTQKNMW